MTKNINTENGWVFFEEILSHEIYQKVGKRRKGHT